MSRLVSVLVVAAVYILLVRFSCFTRTSKKIFPARFTCSRVTIVLPGYFSWIPECAFAHLTVIESNVLSMCFRSVIFMMLELHQYINNIFFPISIEQVKRSIAKRQNSVSNKNIKVKWSYYVQWISRFILPILLMFSISSGRLNAVACVLHIKLYSHTTLLEYAVVCLTFQ